MTIPAFNMQRLNNHRLLQPNLQTPADVVAWYGAVQAQDFAAARWALGLRTQGCSDTGVEQAFQDGAILRTHAMRPTWHFLTPADIRWVLQLTSPRVHAGSGTMYRRLEIDEPVIRQSREALIRALQGGQQRTRSELGEALSRAGIPAQDLRLGYLIMHEELDGVICSGPRRGKQFTYMLLEERVPQARVLDREEALAELTRRYFTAHGPALIKDFAWWSGLTTADIKIGLELNRGHLIEEEIDGKTYWRDPAPIPAVDLPSPWVLLLPPYDEYGIAYKDHSAILDSRFVEQAKNMLYGGATVIDGQAAGYWRRTFSKGAVVIENAPFRPFSPAENEAFAAAAQRYGEFLGMKVEIR